MSILELNIFGKKLSEVTSDDVKDFCQKQNREGINLDYKKDFSSPKKIAKTVAAMANTLGGWVIIGVDDDGDDKPKLPAEGIDWDKQLSLRVTNLVIDNISPPALPIVHVCEPDKKNKTFVVLYVQESNNAPHWLFNENKLCIRLADRTSSAEWERLASADEWEYLRRKREKALETYKLHRELLDDLFDAYDYESEYEYNRSKSSGLMSSVSSMPMPRMAGEENTKEKINIVISPKYPTQELFAVKDSMDIIDSIKFKDAYGTSSYFPFRDLNVQYNTFQRGTHIYFADKSRERINYFALNQFGMFSFKQNVLYYDIGSSTETIILDQLLVQFKQSLLFAKKLYEKLNYLGIINIDALVDGQSWMKLVSSTDSLFASAFDLKAPLSTIHFMRDTSLTELNDEKAITMLVQEFYEEVANSFSWEPVRRSNLQDILKPFGI